MDRSLIKLTHVSNTISIFKMFWCSFLLLYMWTWLRVCACVPCIPFQCDVVIWDAGNKNTPLLIFTNKNEVLSCSVVGLYGGYVSFLRKLYLKYALAITNESNRIYSQQLLHACKWFELSRICATKMNSNTHITHKIRYSMVKNAYIYTMNCKLNSLCDINWCSS